MREIAGIEYPSVKHGDLGARLTAKQTAKRVPEYSSIYSFDLAGELK